MHVSVQKHTGKLTKYNVVAEDGGFISPFSAINEFLIMEYNNNMKTVGKEKSHSKKTEKKEQEGANLPFYYQYILVGLNTPACSILLVSKPEFIIGCAPDCDAILHYSKEISRHHACISWTNGLLTIKDLNSTNYTFLNGETLIPDHLYTISNGDQVTFASYTYEIKEIRF